MIRQIICTVHRCTYLEGSRCEACAAELEGAQPPERELNPDHPAWASVRFLTTLAELEVSPTRQLDEMTHHSGGLVPEGASRTVTGRTVGMQARAEEFECAAHGHYYSLTGPTCPVCERTGRNALSFDRNNLHSCVLHGNYYSTEGRCPACEANRRASAERAALHPRAQRLADMGQPREFLCNEHGSYFSFSGPICPVCSAPADGLGLDHDHLGSCGVHGNYYNASGLCPICEENTHASVDLHRAWRRSLPNEMDTRYRQQLRDCAQLDVPHLAVSDADALSYADVYRPSCRQPLEFVCQDEEEMHLIAQTFIYGVFFGIGENFATVGFYDGPDNEAYFVGFVIEDPWRNIVVHIHEDKTSDSSSEYRATTLHMNLRKVDEMLPVEHPDPVAKPGRKIRARPRKGEPK